LRALLLGILVRTLRATPASITRERMLTQKHDNDTLPKYEVYEDVAEKLALQITLLLWDHKQALVPFKVKELSVQCMLNSTSNKRKPISPSRIPCSNNLMEIQVFTYVIA